MDSCGQGADVDDAPGTEDLDLASVTTCEQLAVLLRTVHLMADKPSLRTLEARTRHRATPLSKTVASEMLKGKRFPRKAVMVSFLQACGIQDDRLSPWLRAWERIVAQGPYNQSTAATEPPEQNVNVEPSARHLPSAVEGTSTHFSEKNDQFRADNAALRLEPTANHRQSTRQQPSPDGVANARTVRSPTASRRELGTLLRALRSEKGLTVEQVADRLLCSPSKVSRMETGHGISTPRDIRDLCELYQITDEAKRERMVYLALEGRQQGWWHSHDLDFDTYVGLEEDAVATECFNSSVIPGVLQTADYARAVHEVVIPKLDPRRIEELVEVRMTRQRRLSQDNPPRFSAVLDEAVFHRMVGGRRVMAAQLSKVLEMAAWSNILIQVLPYELGRIQRWRATSSLLSCQPQLQASYSSRVSSAPSIWIELTILEGTVRFSNTCKRLR